MNLEKLLGAGKPATLQKFSLYLPDKDRNGEPVDQLDKWKHAAMLLFADVNGGATLLPPAQGIWDPGHGGEPVREGTSVLYSFVRLGPEFEAALPRIAAFIHTFGKHTNQGEVMAEFSGEVRGRGFVSRAYFVSDYKLAGEKPF